MNRSKFIIAVVAVLYVSLSALALSTGFPHWGVSGEHNDDECEGNSGGGAMMFIPSCWLVAIRGDPQAQYRRQLTEQTNKEIAAYSAKLNADLAAAPPPPITYEDHNDGVAPPVFLPDDGVLSVESCKPHDSLVACTFRNNQAGPISMSSYLAKCLTGSGRLLAQASLAGVVQGASTAEIAVIRAPDLTERIIIERRP